MNLFLRIAVTCLLAVCVAGSFACSNISVPNLEDRSCAEARDSAKRFYSFHFGNSLAPSAEDLKKRESFVTPELYARLVVRTENPEDYFTSTSDYPKAFRVGECRVESPERVSLEIVLFWRDDQRSEQKTVNATLVRSEGKWLIDEVTPR